MFSFSFPLFQILRNIDAKEHGKTSSVRKIICRTDLIRHNSGDDDDDDEAAVRKEVD